MWNYIIRRLILLPITLFFIVIVNFVIINLAPGDPATVSEISPDTGAARRGDRAVVFGSDDRYLQFREYYGLTLPILFNTWPYTTKEKVVDTLWQLAHHKETPESKEEIPFKDYEDQRIAFGDRSRFIMPILLEIASDPKVEPSMRKLAIMFFVRGGNRQGILGPNLSESQMQWNRLSSKNNEILSNWLVGLSDDPLVLSDRTNSMKSWFKENENVYQMNPTGPEKIKSFFLDTRFFRYMSRVLTLDFGTLRNDSNKTVIKEVTKRFKYSLTLAFIPMLITFALCQLFGFIMAYKHHQWPDIGLNFIFLLLYAIPVFVVAPFLIENVALNRTFPFTDTPIPISGFTSPDRIYNNQTSYQRLFDVLTHIFLPIIAIMYGSLAVQSRLSRTAVLETLRQDYVRTARAKGLSEMTILFKHVGRNAGITILTSIAGSLGIILGGSLIVETLFGINGFGKFFYDAVINRDYNVIMFSVLAGSFLTLLGYLFADIAYTIFDPRVTLD